MATPTHMFEIGPTAAGAPLLETLESVLGAARHGLLAASRGLDAARLDAQPSAGVDSIGAKSSHIAAAERMFQNVTERGFTFAEEEKGYAAAFRSRSATIFQAMLRACQPPPRRLQRL